MRGPSLALFCLLPRGFRPGSRTWSHRGAGESSRVRLKDSGRTALRQQGLVLARLQFRFFLGLVLIYGFTADVGVKLI